MAVKVLIRRTVRENKIKEMIPLFRQMRSLAMNQTGYISGETLKHMVKRETFLVISTWETAADWERWFSSEERRKLQSKIDSLLEEKTEYDIFYFGLDDKEII